MRANLPIRLGFGAAMVLLLACAPAMGQGRMQRVGAPPPRQQQGPRPQGQPGQFQRPGQQQQRQQAQQRQQQRQEMQREQVQQRQEMRQQGQLQQQIQRQQAEPQQRPEMQRPPVQAPVQMQPQQPVQPQVVQQPQVQQQQRQMQRQQMQPQQVPRQQPQMQAQAPVVRQAPNGAAMGSAQSAARRPGLEQWMENHKNLPPAEQLRQLQSDPTFRGLPAQQQQGALNEMRRLQTMNPQQLNRRQALLRMSPEQRQQFNGAMYQYATLPPERQRVVGGAFAALRRVPAGERQAAMSSSPQVQQLSPQERQTLGNMLAWEPYMAPAGGR